MSYCVIGGQYERHYYGERETLHAAKLLATKCVEHWDNWQGWRTPKIYRKEDTVEIKTHGWITYNDGSTTRIPNGEPCAVRESNGRWNKNT